MANPMGTDPADNQNHAIFNATTRKSTDVDPRTGLLEAYVPLPAVVGNAGNGPVVDMGLFYTPLVNNAAALGDGWSFAFTTYHESTGQLTLHSGEMLQVAKGQALTTASVIVTWENSASVIRVKRRDGRVETLKQVASSKVYVPDTLTTDGYNILTMSWTSTEHVIAGVRQYQIQLLGIRDPLRQLVRVDYQSIDAVSLTFWPDDASETLIYRLALRDYALRSVTAPSGTQSTFDYYDHPKCGWLLTQLRTFEGLEHVVLYLDNGIIFEDNPKLSALPCVNTHEVVPYTTGLPLQSVFKRYSYGRTSAQTYETTAVVQDLGGLALHTTVYEYNARHEVTVETVYQSNTRVVRNYNVSAGEYGDISEYHQGGAQRREQMSTLYDQQGAVMAITEGGIRTDFTTYREPSQGSYGQNTTIARYLAAADNNSLLNTLGGVLGGVLGTLLEQIQIVYGELFDQGLGFAAGRDFASKYTLSEAVRAGTQPLRTPGSPDPFYNEGNERLRPLLKGYRYVAIPGFHDYKVSYTLQIVNAASSIRNAALVGQQIEYYTANDFRKGRQRRIVQGRADARGELIPEAGLVRTFTYTLAGTALTIITTDTDAQGNTRTRSETQSILSGRLISQVDEDGNQTLFEYDASGRLSALVHCAQSATFKQTTRYSYPSPGRVEITEASGRQQAIQQDGQDNVVEEYVRASSSESWRQTLAVEYDAQGRKSLSTSIDYLADGTPVQQSCLFGYDDWGNEFSRTYSNGQKVFNRYDPISLTRAQWTGTVDDRHGIFTQYHPDGSVARVEWKDADGVVYQTQLPTYTHARQVATLVTTGVHGQHSINYTYDGGGRLLGEAHVEQGPGVPALSYTYHYRYPQSWFISEADRVEIEFSGARRILGARTFDSWGRVLSITRGTVTETFSYAGANPLPATRRAADGKVLSYEYIKELNNRVGKISLANSDLIQTYTYAHGASLTSSAGEGERLLRYQHDVNQQINAERVQLQAQSEIALSRTISEGGRLLSDSDALGVVTQYTYSPDTGQRLSAANSEASTSHTYEPAAGLHEEVVTVVGVPAPATVRYTYDAQQRETARRFVLPGQPELILTREYFADSRLKRVALVQDGTLLGTREFNYTAGGRLALCRTSGVWQPRTPANKAVDSQAFTYDALGNVTRCVTVFGNEQCITTYTYDASSQSRLEQVRHDHPDYPPARTLSYDPNGRVVQDHTGKTYAYDGLGRLTQAGSSRYLYDPANRLLSRGEGDGRRQLIYDGLSVRGEYQPGGSSTRYLCPGSQACTVLRMRRSGVDRVLFELRDAEGTVLASYDAQAETLVHHAYSAYGEHYSQAGDSLLGFNGEYRDSDTDQYPLGQGYRWYAPASLQFHAQDSLSPFGVGGPQAYGYCAGDPVNTQDPSGHIGSGAVSRRLRATYGDGLPPPLGLGQLGALISTVIWGGVGVLTAVVSGGTSLLLTGVLTGLAIVSAGTAIAAVTVLDTHPQLAQILGWVSLGAAVLGGVAALARKIGQLAVRLGRSSLTLARRLYRQAAMGVERIRDSLKASRASRVLYRPAGNNVQGLDDIADALAPVNVSRIAPLASDAQSLVQESLMTRLWGNYLGVFDLGDLDTVVATVTGVFGNLNYFDSDVAGEINSRLSASTALSWSGYKLGRLR